MNFSEGIYDKQIDEAMRQALEDIDYLVNKDLLTGTYNRLKFEETLDRIQQNNTTNVSMIIADINGLRQINESFGHDRGDDILITAACIMQEISDIESVYRIGGDEFAIIMTNTDSFVAEHKALIMKTACRGKVFCSDIEFSISTGIAHRSSELMPADIFFKIAENSLYANKLREKDSLYSEVVTSLKETMRARDLETTEHLMRMEILVSAVGQRMDLSEQEFHKLVLLAFMHDIGKIGIPDSVIHKPSRLTDSEFGIMKEHAVIGCNIAKSTNLLSHIAREIRHHHERWDGNGYPDGLAGEKIPLLSRVITAADAFDVMTHQRVYKEALPVDYALEELESCSGGQFDPDVAASLINIIQELEVPNNAELPIVR